ncbi:MAG: hypothetical protein E7373_05020 [Clostridiales bacterium]|nr:hypothetical protein [Clostridiales bacterium]
MIKDSKYYLCFTFKILTVIFSIGGVILSLFNATLDGYKHWYNRTMYFTAQSNLWIGSVFLAIIIIDLFFPNFNEKYYKKLYYLKYVLTVSISVTGIVFLALLAPFADESYHVWSLSGILTHILSPAFAIADFFLDDYLIILNKKSSLKAILPPLFYLLSVIIFHLLKIDFGRGQTFPYFFLNFSSPAGIFGFSNQAPFFMGSFYWLIILLVLVYLLALVYAKLKNNFQTH